MRRIYKYFFNPTGRWDNGYVLMACSKDGGYLFKYNGQVSDYQFYDGWNFNYAIRNRLKEVSFNKALEKIEISGRHLVYKKLGIPLEPITITAEIKERIFNKLKENYAFNEDSAFDLDDEDFQIGLQLEENGEIKSYDGGFFLKKGSL